MFTPQEVSEKVFPKAPFGSGGYSMSNVDEFLDALTEDYTALYKENVTLKAKLKVLAEKVEEYRSTEDAMRQTLLTAQKMAAKLVQEAQAEKDQLLADAKAEAEAEVRRLDDEKKAAQQKLQSQFGAEKTQLEKQAKDLQSKGEALQAQVAKMSAKEREDKQMEFLRLRRAFEEKSRNFARKVENTENQIRQSMAQQIYDAATTIAKQQKLDLILDAAAGSVMYATPTLDITKPVLAEVNRLWKAGGSKFPEPNTGKK